ncbi:hypothetical protein HDU98_012244 [Podochytrium sp. JEL0797]|nr:hypothetical protein HDU98_012244 [Podochytrium sp. JEL0797]
MRFVIAQFKGTREIETWRRRAKTMLLVDRVPLLRDYRLLSELKPGSHLLEILDEYDGVNMFMDSAPLKTPKVEDYITEFEILCAHFSVETSMLQEDGRPFSYEVDGRFTCKFLEQVLEANFAPYDQPSDSEKAAGSSNISPTEKTAVDVKAASLANATFVLSTSGIHPPRIKTADWLSEFCLHPELEEHQEKQSDILKQQKDCDFEFMCEMDLMKCNDMDTVLHRIKENAKRTWELGVKQSNAKPLIVKSSSLSKPGSRAIQEPEKLNVSARLPESFDLSMMVPDGRDHLSDRHVLDGKKQVYVKMDANKSNGAFPKLPEVCSEDIRSYKNGNVDIADQKSVSIIYDAAISDLQALEAELLKMATIYINNGINGRIQARASFFDDLLLKRDRSKSQVSDITFINPLVDRAQILLELLDCEVKFQNAKIEVGVDTLCILR